VVYIVAANTGGVGAHYSKRPSQQTRIQGPSPKKSPRSLHKWQKCSHPRNTYVVCKTSMHVNINFSFTHLHHTVIDILAARSSLNLLTQRAKSLSTFNMASNSGDKTVRSYSLLVILQAALHLSCCSRLIRDPSSSTSPVKRL
jgi:hypothetical protein